MCHSVLHTHATTVVAHHVVAQGFHHRSTHTCHHCGSTPVVAQGVPPPTGVHHVCGRTRVQNRNLVRGNFLRDDRCVQYTQNLSLYRVGRSEMWARVEGSWLWSRLPPAGGSCYNSGVVLHRASLSVRAPHFSVQYFRRCSCCHRP